MPPDTVTDSGTAADRIDARRYRRIMRFFLRVTIHLVWWDLLLARIVPARARSSRPGRLQHLARGFRELAIDMGGVMIKAGQFLSSRVDVLPPEITDELAGLQDEVPPAPFETISGVIEQELGRPPDQIFEEFETVPQAAASLGQVHRAKLIGGDDRSVVVKIQRPGIERLVETDLAALRSIARWLMMYPPIRRRADMPALVREFSQTTWEELDYEHEGRNAERFAEMFAGDQSVQIPAVHQNLTTRRVLVLEDVEAIKITDLTAIESAGVRCSDVAAKVFDVYLHQVFEEGFFHADPHPGNLFVRPLGPPTDGQDGRAFSVVFVDFGMIGRVPPEVGDQLRQVLLALATRDARRIVLAGQRLGMFLPNADLDRVERAISKVLDQFWGMNITELASVDYGDMQELAVEFRDLLFELPFQVPNDFVFLGRAVGMLSGLATTLDKDFDPWAPIEAYAEGMILGESRWSGLRQGLDVVGSAVQPLLVLPGQLERLLRQANMGELEVMVSPGSEFDRDLRRLAWAADRLFWGMVFAALLLAGTWLYQSDLRLTGTLMWAGAALALLRGLMIARKR